VRSLLLVLLLAWPLLTPAPLAAQDGARLEAFVAHVARLWEAEDASAIAQLAQRSGRILLEVAGEGGGEVGERHAAAALRALFGDRKTVSIRPARTTLAGGRPLQGFGELAWVSRPRGVTVPQSSKVYVGVVWEGDGWRIRELRVLP
jgi:hypothetical protein